MRTIRIKIYSFNELSNDAKEIAIEKIRNSYYEYNDFASCAIDNCSLFEPKQSELKELFGENYNFPLIKNNRKGIYFDTDRNSFLDCEKAMEITNEYQFLLWLGLTDEIINGEDFSFNIFTPKYHNSDTTIEFDGYDSDFDGVIEVAKDKFDNLISDILTRISEDIEYRYSDESIIEDIEANDIEFLANGNRF